MWPNRAISRAAMASDIQFCTWLDHVWRFRITCWNWNQPSIRAQMAQSEATIRIRPLSRVQGQKATKGAVHAKVQMHQMGLKQVTWTNNESGNAHCSGNRTGSIDPTKRNTHAAKTIQ